MIDIFNFGICGKISIIEMKNHVILLDYDNGTFKKFSNMDELEEYANEILKLVDKLKE